MPVVASGGGTSKVPQGRCGETGPNLSQRFFSVGRRIRTCLRQGRSECGFFLVMALGGAPWSTWLCGWLLRAADGVFASKPPAQEGREQHLNFFDLPR